MIIANPIYDTQEPIVQKMLDRLQRVMANEEVRHHMDVEDEIDRAFERHTKEKDEVIAVQEKVIAKKDEALAETKQEVEELRRQLAEFQKQDKK